LFAEPVLKIFVEAGRSYRWCRRCGFREWVELPPHPFIEDYQDEKLRQREVLEHGIDAILKRHRPGAATVNEALGL
jgi:hypothetical protein